MASASRLVVGQFKALTPQHGQHMLGIHQIFVASKGYKKNFHRYIPYISSGSSAESSVVCS